MTFNEHTTPISGDLHPEMQMNIAVAEKMHWVTSIIFGSIFVFMSLQIPSILVWSRKSQRCSTETYLNAQAVSNMGLVVFFFATDALIMMEPGIKKNFANDVFYSYVGYPLFSLFVVCSIWLTVGVTIDRYIQVCWIVQAKADLRIVNESFAIAKLGLVINAYISFVLYYCLSGREWTASVARRMTSTCDTGDSKTPTTSSKSQALGEQSQQCTD